MSDDVISNNRARGREEREVTRTRKGKRRTKESNSDVSMRVMTSSYLACALSPILK